MPSVTQPAGSKPLQKQYQSARTVSVISVLGVTLALIGYIILALSQGDWRYWFIASTTAILLASTIIALVLVEKKHIEAGMWVLIVGGSITFFTPTFVFTNMALLQGPGLVILTAIITLQVFPPSRSRINALLFALVSGILNILLDIFLPIERPFAPPIVMVSIGGVFVFALIAQIISFRRQFQNVTLRTKITIFFVIVSILAVVLISAINIITTRAILLRTAQNNIQVAASNLANEIDNWISATLTSIRAEAQNPLFYKALTESRSPDIERDALQALIALRNKNPIFIESYSLLDRNGKILLSTDPADIGANEDKRDYFQIATQQGLPTISLWYAENRIYLSTPVRDPNNNIVGVLRARYTASILQQFITQSKGLGGEASFAMLVDNYNIILAHGRYPNLIFKSLAPINAQVLLTWQEEGRFLPGEPESFALGLDNIAQQLAEGKTTLAIKDVYGVEQRGAIVQLKQQPWKLIFAQPRDFLIRPINQEIQQSFLISAAILLLSFYAAYNLSKVIATPVVRLTETARQIADGHIEQQAEVTSDDEIGQLSRAFNTMTAQLRDLIGSLEQRVAERTRNIERRALLLQTATEVGQTAIQTRDIESLLSQITHLISERFGFYHVGIFLLDERGEYAVLRAANSEGGQRMLARGHKLGVGQTGIVGCVTARGEARIALDVGADAVFFDNPDLPETRSEMALPLIAGNTILGALDVQSTEEAAFKEEDIATLQVMANQIAIAIENARLFAESQAAIEATRRAYGEVSRKAWQLWLQENTALGYLVSSNDRLVPISTEKNEPEFLQAMQQAQPVLSADRQVVFTPIRMRGETIGGLRLVKPRNESWSDEEVHLIDELTNQLSAALESARLFEETAARAERERTVAEVTTAIRSVVEPDSMLRIAIEELKRVLGAEQITIQPYTTSSPASSGKSRKTKPSS